MFNDFYNNKKSVLLALTKRILFLDLLKVYTFMISASFDASSSSTFLIKLLVRF
jgi:hypothetical protein